MTGETTELTSGTAKKLKFIQLSEGDIQAFQKFQHIYPELVIMLEAGVFDFKGGSVIIHRDADGKLQLIISNLAVYKASHH